MNLLADRFEAFVEFLEALRLQGYNIGTQQYLAAQNLLIALAARGQLSDDPKRLSTLLAPIFCTSAEEQEAFYREYEQWVERIGGQKTSDDKPVLQGKKAGAATEKRQTQGDRLKRLQPYALLTLAGMVFVAFTVAWFSIPQWGGTKAVPGATAFGVLIRPPTSSDYKTWRDQYAHIKDTNPTGRDESSAIPVSPPSTASVEAPAVAAWRSLWSRFHTTVRVAAAALPFLLLGAWWLWQRLRQLRLKRRPSKVAPQLEEIKVRGVAEHLFRQADLRRAAQQLRRHREVAVLDLAAQATVEMTARKGGWFTPVYSPRKALPEYLILIDRSSFADQMARLEDELIDRFVENDIHVNRYYFDGDPRLCRKGLEAPYLKLQDLEAKHPNNFLLIFSDGAGLVNPLTGRPQRWLDLFVPWAGRALMTPEPPPNWGYRERALTDRGFAVLPATANGIPALVKILQTGNLPGAEPGGTPQLYPEILSDRPERWYAGFAPDDEDIELLRIELQYYLGMRGYYWLCACAVYPALHWNLTLYFGYKLTGLEGLEERLMNLVRLPWFRQGNWPDWLRARLISSLPADEESATRRALDELLLTALENPDDFALKVAPTSVDREGSRLAGWWRKLSARVQTAYRKLRLRRLIKDAPPTSPWRDYVFLSFLSGNKPDQLAVSVPQVLRRLLFKESQSLLGLRPASAFLLAGLISFLGWQLIPQPRPVVEPVRPQFSARPASGFQGSSIRLQIANTVEGADCRTQSLQGASLSGTGSISDGRLVRAAVISSEDCQLMADVTIAADAPVGPVTLTLRKGGEVLGSFPFQIRQTEVAPVPDPEYVARPFSGRAGSTLTITVSNMLAVSSQTPGINCRYGSLRGAELKAPDSSGISIGEIRTDDCRLITSLAIERTARLGLIPLTLSNAMGELGTINFRVTAGLPALPPRLTVEPQTVLRGVSQRFRIKNPDCRNYSLRGATLVSPDGVSIKVNETDDCEIDSLITVGRDAAIVDTVTLIVRKQDTERPVEIKISADVQCPELQVAWDKEVTEGEMIHFMSRVDGVEDAVNEQLPFVYSVNGQDKYPDELNRTLLDVATAGMGGQTVVMSVMVNLEKIGKGSCTLSKTCRVLVRPKPEVRTTQAGPPTLEYTLETDKVDSKVDNITFKDQNCLVDRIRVEFFQPGLVDGKGNLTFRATAYFRDKTTADITNLQIIDRFESGKPVTCNEVVRLVRRAER